MISHAPASGTTSAEGQASAWRTTGLAAPVVSS